MLEVSRRARTLLCGILVIPACTEAPAFDLTSSSAGEALSGSGGGTESSASSDGSSSQTGAEDESSTSSSGDDGDPGSSEEGESSTGGCPPEGWRHRAAPLPLEADEYEVIVTIDHGHRDSGGKLEFVRSEASRVVFDNVELRRHLGYMGATSVPLLRVRDDGVQVLFPLSDRAFVGTVERSSSEWTSAQMVELPGSADACGLALADLDGDAQPDLVLEGCRQFMGSVLPQPVIFGPSGAGDDLSSILDGVLAKLDWGERRFRHVQLTGSGDAAALVAVELHSPCVAELSRFTLSDRVVREEHFDLPIPRVYIDALVPIDRAAQTFVLVGGGQAAQLRLAKDRVELVGDFILGASCNDFHGAFALADIDGDGVRDFVDHAQSAGVWECPFRSTRMGIGLASSSSQFGDQTNVGIETHSSLMGQPRALQYFEGGPEELVLASEGGLSFVDLSQTAEDGLVRPVGSLVGSDSSSALGLEVVDVNGDSVEDLVVVVASQTALALAGAHVVGDISDCPRFQHSDPGIDLVAAQRRVVEDGHVVDAA